MPLRPSRKPKPSRRSVPQANRPQPTAPVTVLSITPSGQTITVQFSQAVTLDGTPNYTTDVVGAHVVSATLTGPTTLELAFDADVSAATQVIVPYEEPSVRNASGGFVAPTALAA